MLNTNLKILILCFLFQCLASANEVEVEETVVIGLSPGTNNLLDSFKAPYKAQKIDSSGVELSLANDLPSSLERSVGGVHLTDAQNNPFPKRLIFPWLFFLTVTWRFARPINLSRKHTFE